MGNAASKASKNEKSLAQHDGLQNRAGQCGGRVGVGPGVPQFLRAQQIGIAQHGRCGLTAELFERLLWDAGLLQCVRS